MGDSFGGFVMILWDFPEIIHVPEYMKEERKKRE